MQGFVLNRAGDTVFILALAIAFASQSTTHVLLAVATNGVSCPQSYMGLLVLAGAAGKSAQLGLHA